jgi:beta-glucosidase
VKLTDKASIPGVINSMTLQEKLSFLTGTTMFRTATMEKYDIPEVYYLDGGTGASLMQMILDARQCLSSTKHQESLFSDMERVQNTVKIISAVTYPETIDSLDENTRQKALLVKELIDTKYMPDGIHPGCFPPGILLASTWDAQVVYECARAVGNEACFFGIDVLLGSPNVNIQRDPLNGRLFEGYSEDPYLVSALAPSFVRGIQDEGIIANVKHFAANNQETNRRNINEIISEKALHEIYFPGFKACVQEGGCKTVMSAYNYINGVACAHNGWLLREVLKKEWAFKGFVVSDWGAAYDQVAALRGGTDLDMPGPRSIEPILEAIKNEEINESAVDEAVTRILEVLVDMPKEKRLSAAIDRAASAKAAYNAVKEGLILLKNIHSTLPLAGDAHVSLFGEGSKKFIESGGGSANVVTTESTSLFDSLANNLGQDAVVFGEILPQTDTVIITVGSMGSEGSDRRVMDLEPDDKELLLDTIAKAKQAGKRIVVILNVCGPVDMTSYINDIDAIVCVFIPGMEGGHAAADMLCGKFNPSGKLPITFGKRYKDYGSSVTFPGWNMEIRYNEDIYVGYRHFDRWNIDPLFPFGYGLSYTSFSISNVRLNNNTLSIEQDGELLLSVDVTNTGNMAGKEVVQVYLNAVDPIRPRPLKELKAFKKINLEPGQTKTIEFSVQKKILQIYDERQGWIAIPGKYNLLVGSSSRDIAQTVPFTAIGHNPYGLTGKSSLNDISNTPGALEVLIDAVPEGVISRESINTATLFSASMTPLEDFWKHTVEPRLDPKVSGQIYQAVLRKLNHLDIGLLD